MVNGIDTPKIPIDEQYSSAEEWNRINKAKYETEISDDLKRCGDCHKTHENSSWTFYFSGKNRKSELRCTAEQKFICETKYDNFVDRIHVVNGEFDNTNFDIKTGKFSDDLFKIKSIDSIQILSSNRDLLKTETCDYVIKETQTLQKDGNVYTFFKKTHDNNECIFTYQKSLGNDFKRVYRFCELKNKLTGKLIRIEFSLTSYSYSSESIEKTVEKLYGLINESGKVDEYEIKKEKYIKFKRTEIIREKKNYKVDYNETRKFFESLKRNISENKQVYDIPYEKLNAELEEEFHFVDDLVEPNCLNKKNSKSKTICKIYFENAKEGVQRIKRIDYFNEKDECIVKIERIYNDSGFCCERKVCKLRGKYKGTYIQRYISGCIPSEIEIRNGDSKTIRIIKLAGGLITEMRVIREDTPNTVCNCIYDELNRIKKVTVQKGEEIKLDFMLFEYDEEKVTATVTDPFGCEKKFTYYDSEFLNTIVHCDNLISKFDINYGNEEENWLITNTICIPNGNDNLLEKIYCKTELRGVYEKPIKEEFFNYKGNLVLTI